jgi:hypothetical protein
MDSEAIPRVAAQRLSGDHVPGVRCVVADREVAATGCGCGGTDNADPHLPFLPLEDDPAQGCATAHPEEENGRAGGPVAAQMKGLLRGEGELRRRFDDRHAVGAVVGKAEESRRGGGEGLGRGGQRPLPGSLIAVAAPFSPRR